MKFPAVLRISFSFFLFAICLSSCKKDGINDNDGESVIRFTFNGEQFEYTSGAFGNISQSDGMNLMVIGGYKNFSAASALKEQISLIVYSNATIKSGETYHDPVKAVSNNGTKMPQVIITHYDRNETGFQTVGLFSDENGVVVGSDLIPALKTIAIDARVAITELSENRIKGKFSGTAYQADSWTSAKKFPISAGEFSVNRQQ